MSDIVERLTDHANGAYDMTPICSDLLDAAAEIGRPHPNTGEDE